MSIKHFGQYFVHARFLGFLRLSFFIAFAAMVVESVVMLAVPLLIKSIVDDALVAGRHEKLVVLVVWLLGVMLCGSLLGLVKNMLVVHLHKDIKRGIMTKLGSHTQRLSIGHINNSNSSQYVTRMSIDTANLDPLLASGMIDIIRNVLMVVAIFIVALKISPFLMLLSCTLLPLVYLMYTIGSRGIEELSGRAMNHRETIGKLISEDISGIQTIRAHGIEAQRGGMLSSCIDQLQNLEVKLGLRGSFMVLSSEGLGIAANFIIWGVGGYFVLNGRSSIGEIVAFSTYLTMIFGPITSVFGAYMGVQKSLASVRRIYDVFDSPQQLDSPEAVKLEKCTGKLDFCNVSFKYPRAEAWTIKNVSFSVAPRSPLAIVGPNGAGKSTLAALSALFYDVDTGAVMLDGIDIRGLQGESLRKHLAIVSQTPFFFDTTVENNIALWRTGISHEMVVECAKAAHAHDFIMALPEQYNTRIGESGSQLSGGQRQRMAIARALVGEPRVIVLDETSAHIDEFSEGEIYRTLADIKSNYALIVISHKLATLKHVDNIIVLDKGEIVDSGSLNHLVANSERFRSIFNITSGTDCASVEKIDSRKTDHNEVA